MAILYGDNSMSQKEVNEQMERFKELWMNIGSVHSGWPSRSSSVSVCRTTEEWFS
jgi:hypothetical protein